MFNQGEFVKRLLKAAKDIREEMVDAGFGQGLLEADRMTATIDAGGVRIKAFDRSVPETSPDDLPVLDDKGHLA